MKLRYVALNIEPRQYSGFFNEQFIFEFNKSTEFIRNYISKAIRKFNYQTDGTFNMLLINPCEENGGCNILRAFSILQIRLVVLPDEVESYLKMTDLTAKYEYYLSLLERGYQQANIFRPIPIKELLAIHQQFRKQGYKNEWLFKKVRIAPYNMILYFKCYFTISEFRLELEAYDIKTKNLMSTGIIKKTFPDELYFAKSFKKIIIENNMLTILDFLSKPAFEINLDKIRQGIFNVNDIEGLWWNKNS